MTYLVQGKKGKTENIGMYDTLKECRRKGREYIKSWGPEGNKATVSVYRITRTGRHEIVGSMHIMTNGRIGYNGKATKKDGTYKGSKKSGVQFVRD